MTATTAPLGYGARPARRLNLRRPLTVALWIAVLSAAYVAATHAGKPAPYGAAPSFTLDDVRHPGSSVTVAAGRPTVVAFFAAWCEPCRDELPRLEQAYQKAAGAVDVVAVDVNDSRRLAGELLDASGATFPAGYDPHEAVAGRYKVNGLPTTVFVGADGRVAAVTRGRLTAAELERRMAGLTEGS
ncbi:MAG TPA: TlpA disulfide reductase family protein [Acidimicrobiales bacterium]|nr:TlpA disulfide reductase family protein [Acidimicrobiales bacterium]